MPTVSARVGLARKTLGFYLQEDDCQHRWRHPTESNDVAECDIVDLMTDMLLLARAGGCDPCTVLWKTQVHLNAETGTRCPGPKFSPRAQ
ncbi:hypothetical protein [Methylobacterium dankookense]|uniref:hypothetical protein n=1 Tax=Methylobacterium dankookense TaxID=560405 RepID=UPI0011A70D53|nr:hypothetical protein [Methylobacterium dankookense]